MAKPTLKIVGDPERRKGKLLHKVYIEYKLDGRLRWVKFFASHALVVNERGFKHFIERVIESDTKRAYETS